MKNFSLVLVVTLYSMDNWSTTPVFKRSSSQREVHRSGPVSITLPCRFQDLPTDIKEFITKGKYLGIAYMPCENPFDTLLFPKSMLVKPEFRHLMKDTSAQSYVNLAKWQNEKWQENERMLASVPSDFRQNGIARYREQQEADKKMSDAIRNEIRRVEGGEINGEVKEYLEKKKELQENWLKSYVKAIKISYNRDYHIKIL
jgi:hypothetical protein